MDERTSQYQFTIREGDEVEVQLAREPGRWWSAEVVAINHPHRKLHWTKGIAEGYDVIRRAPGYYR